MNILNANIIKKLNEHTPDFAKKIFAPMIRSKLVNNKVFLDQYNEIKTFEQLSEKEKRKKSLEKLKQQLCYAYENIEYYKEVFNEISFNPYEIKSFDELKKIPYINKEIINQNYEKFISKEKIDFYNTQTGGTTGDPLVLYMDKDSIYKEKAFIYSHWSKLGYDYKKSRIITFRGIQFNNKIYKYNPIYNEIILSPFELNTKNIQQYINIINKFNPEYIHGYPSAIVNLCKILKEGSLTLSCRIKGVFIISEELNINDKKFIENFLKCKTLSFYGHSERAVFSEEYDSNYTFNELYGYTELIPTNEENTYNIVCTGFLNKKMPLIRYRTDDYVIVKDNKTMIKGRESSLYLIGNNDEKISLASKVFHNFTNEKIRAYQFIQNQKGIAEVNIISDRLKPKEIDRMEKELNNNLRGSVQLKIKKVDSLILTNRGKKKILIQKIS